MWANKKEVETSRECKCGGNKKELEARRECKCGPIKRKLKPGGSPKVRFG